MKELATSGFKKFSLEVNYKSRHLLWTYVDSELISYRIHVQIDRYQQQTDKRNSQTDVTKVKQLRDESLCVTDTYKMNVTVGSGVLGQNSYFYKYFSNIPTVFLADAYTIETCLQKYLKQEQGTESRSKPY